DESVPPKPEGEAAPGLEQLLRIDPVDVKEAARVKAALDENTMVFGTSGPTARSQARGRDMPDVLARPHAESPQEPMLARRGMNAGDLARHSLRVYLDGNLLGGPARITLPDVPPMVLDPKLKVFHSPGRLAEL